MPSTPVETFVRLDRWDFTVWDGPTDVQVWAEGIQVLWDDEFHTWSDDLDLHVVDFWSVLGAGLAVLFLGFCAGGVLSFGFVEFDPDF